jgi:hypothetical protein
VEEEEIAVKFYKRMMMITVVLYKQENASKGRENTGIVVLYKQENASKGRENSFSSDLP